MRNYINEISHCKAKPSLKYANIETDKKKARMEASNESQISLYQKKKKNIKWIQNRATEWMCSVTHSKWQYFH